VESEAEAEAARGGENIGDKAEEENLQPPWEFDYEEPMEKIHVVMGVGVGAAVAMPMLPILIYAI